MKPRRRTWHNLVTKINIKGGETENESFYGESIISQVRNTVSYVRRSGGHHSNDKW